MTSERPIRGARALRLAALLLFAFSVSVLAAPAKAPAAAPETPVKLVVVISVDGLPWDNLAGYQPWFVNGLKRLFTEGQVETATHYAHLNTETGPGHASLGTGAPPQVHGIVANRWVETGPDGKPRRLYCTDQPNAPRIPGQPPLFYREVEKDGRIYVFSRQQALASWEVSGEMGAQITHPGEGPNGETVIYDDDDALYLYHFRHSLEAVTLPPPTDAPTVPGPGNLRVDTLGDAMVKQIRGARVVSLSGKDRGAIFLAGRDPRHVVYWYNNTTGVFTTSPIAYDTYGSVGSAAAKLVKGFNTQRAGTQLINSFGTVWRPLPQPAEADLEKARQAQSCGRTDTVARPEPNIGRYQTTDLGLGFDHDLSRFPRGYFEAIYTSPFQDELLTDLALAFLADPTLALGRRGTPDLLALSFSANDLVSHNFGRESEETLDTLRRLDRQLGRLLAALDQLAAEEPEGSVVLALSADHGFTPLPEVARRHSNQRSGGRLQSDSALEAPFPSFQERMNRVLRDDLCLPADIQPIFAVEGWTVSYYRSLFPVRTEETPCGPAGREVSLADLDQAFRRDVMRLYGDEVQEVLLISERDRWPADDPAVSFAQKDFDAARSGDAFLIPREEVLMHWDPERGSGHGSQHEYDTHVPLLFWGGPFRAGCRTEPSAPYDLAPTLADVLSIQPPNPGGGTSRLEKGKPVAKGAAD